MGTLYIVGTPIGNLEDLTRRAVRVLGQVSLVAAEDTRVTRKLLSHLSIHAPLVSYHSRNWQSRLPSILDALTSGDVALVTDAGMPVVSDPGSELVSAAPGFGEPGGGGARTFSGNRGSGGFRLTRRLLSLSWLSAAARQISYCKSAVSRGLPCSNNNI